MIESPMLPVISLKSSLLGQKMSFDKVIETLGINKFNKRVYFFIALFFMADGSEMAVLSLLINKLTELWDLSSYEKGSLGSSVFVGFAIGSLCSGIISDRKGRRPAYLIGSTLVTIFAAASSLAQGFLSFVFLRIICGFGIGLSIPALFALATELTPAYYRSIILNNVWAVFPIGAAFVIIMTKFFIDLENGWRYILLFASFPCIILLIFSCNVPESPRFHISNRQYEKGFEELDKIIEFAEMKDKITIRAKDREDLISEAEEHHLNQLPAEYSMLFTPEYKKVTVLICCIYFLVSFNYYGASYILPQMFEEEKDSNKGNVGDVYFSLLLGCFFEVPSCVLAGYLANNKHLLRVKTMMLGFFVCGIAAFLLLIFPQSMALAAAIFKSSIAISFNVMFVYACEAYPTKIRSMGVGLGNSCTRFAAILTPFLSQILFDYNEFLPFIFYTFAAFLGVFCCYILPFETYNLVLN